MARAYTLQDILKRFEKTLVQDAGGCLLWQGSRTPDGYGRLIFEGMHRAHRIAYTVANGPIPPGLDVDHLCHNADRECPGGPACKHRACCNPAHLGLADRAENSRRARGRAARCRNGHEFNGANTYVEPSTGSRFCRPCNAAAARRLKERKKVSAR